MLEPVHVPYYTDTHTSASDGTAGIKSQMQKLCLGEKKETENVALI